jgi:putative membrane protein insertion efficiency factor
MSILHFLWRLPGLVLIGLVRGYQYAISPMLQAIAGAQCRFEPSCSEYFIQAVKKHGAVSGALRGVWRVCRCNPYCRGGYDPP